MQQLCMSMRVAMHLGTYATAMHEHAWSFTRSSNTPFVMHLCNSYCMHELACVLHCMIGLYACVCIFIYILCVCGFVYVCMHLSAQSPEQLACLHAVSMPAKRRKCPDETPSSVSSLEGEEFLSTDFEDVAARYAGLLAALAQHNSRVNTSVLQSAAVAIFACTPATAKGLPRR